MANQVSSSDKKYRGDLLARNMLQNQLHAASAAYQRAIKASAFTETARQLASTTEQGLIGGVAGGVIGRGVSGALAGLGFGVALGFIYSKKDTLAADEAKRVRQQKLRQTLHDLKQTYPTLGASNGIYDLQETVDLLFSAEGPFRDVPADDRGPLIDFLREDILTANEVDEPSDPEASAAADYRAICSVWPVFEPPAGSLMLSDDNLDDDLAPLIEEASHDATKFKHSPIIAHEVARARLQARAEQFSQDAASVGRDLDAAASILEKIPGMPPKVAKAARDIGKAVAIASAVAGAFANPVSLLTTLPGLLGGGQDPMAALGASLMQKLEELAAQLRSQHEEVMKELNTIRRAQQYQTGIAVGEMLKLVSKCMDILPTERMDPTEKSGRFVRLAQTPATHSFDFIRNRLGGRHADFVDAMNGLRHCFPDDPMVSDVFILEPDGTETSDDFVPEHEQMERRIVQVAEALFPELLGDDIHALTMAPSLNIDGLIRKLELGSSGLLASAYTEAPYSSRDFLKRNFGVLLNPVRVIRLGGYLVAAHHYHELRVVAGERIATLDDLLAPDWVPDREGLSELMRALTIVHLALSQQSLLYGDLLIPIAYVVIAHPATAPDAMVDFLPGVLKTQVEKLEPEKQVKLFEAVKALYLDNSLFLRNVLVYAMKTELGSFARTKYSLAAADAKHPVYWEKFTRGTFSFSREKLPSGEDTWIATTSGRSFPIPSAEDIVEGAFLHTPEMLRLLDLRDRIVEEIDSYAPALQGEGEGASGYIRTALLATAPA